jgi:RND family efflux transporter MFP subunit
MDMLPVAFARAFSFLILTLMGVAVQAAEPQQVRTSRLDGVWQQLQHSAPASVVARNAPDLAAEIAARIITVHVDVGDRVSTGQPLVDLDCRSHEATLASRKASVASAVARRRFAEQQLTRANDLRKNKSISEETLDQRRNELAVARADVEAANQGARLAAIDVENCTLAAPFDAVVTSRNASVGGYATRGSLLIGLAETTGQEIQVHLRGEQIESLQNADEQFFDHRGQRHVVNLRAIVPTADPVSRTREARLDFRDTPAIVGTAGRVIWQNDARLLPADFLVRRNNVPGVFIVERDIARFVALPRAQDGRPAVIDLPADTLVVSEGQQSLVDGATIIRAASGNTSP